MITFKEYLTEVNDIKIEDIGDTDEFYDDEPSIDASEAYEYATLLARRVSMGITRDRELRAVALYNDEYAGAIWTSFEDGKYAFDIAVEPKYQGKGIGSKLIDYGIDGFSYYSDYPDSTMEIDVTSQVTKNALERRGFHVSENIGNGRWLMKK